MPNTVLIGTQWGDEGKGKIIDVLARDVDLVVRFQGGNNAGHTVKVDGKKYVLHLIPSGVLYEGRACVIGNGLVVDLAGLVSEIRGVEEQGMSLDGRLFISDRAHAVFPFHKAMDAARENRLSDDHKIGTTLRGIGPAYGDKVARTGLRMADLLEPDFEEMVEARIADTNEILAAMGGTPVDEEAVKAECLAAAAVLRPYIADTITLINKAVAEGKQVLFEGAQGTMLDIDFGTYPYVTSSNTSAGGACTGAGAPPRSVDRVVGVVKAYTTRVGEGPFPTELFDEDGAQMAKVGHEFGATTGRPRRCGWFDAVVARYSAQLNGIDLWAMTKLDVLDGFETIKICVAYECDGERIETVPASVRKLARCKPIYEEVSGWMEPTSDISEYADLPEKARAYVERLCEVTGVPLGILSVGPSRHSTMRIAL
jgi:adenylosuccinate synthase